MNQSCGIQETGLSSSSRRQALLLPGTPQLFPVASELAAWFLALLPSFGAALSWVAPQLCTALIDGWKPALGILDEAPTEHWTGVGTVKQTRDFNSQLSDKKNKPSLCSFLGPGKSNLTGIVGSMFPTRPSIFMQPGVLMQSILQFLH